MPSALQSLLIGFAKPVKYKGRSQTSMWCPRCKSTRVQRGYDDSSIVFQLAGLHELLCNNCGLEFKGFDPLRKLKRAPVKPTGTRKTDRRFPRYKVRLPATISLVERNPVTWEVSYSPAARGYCEVISQGGLSVAFTCSRFREEQMVPGSSFYVTINLPAAIIAAVVSAVTCDSVGSNRPAKWVVGGAFTQMSDDDATKLATYLAKQAKTDRVLAFA